MEFTVARFVIFCAVVILTKAQVCYLRCGLGRTCALVRHGRGPPVPNCITHWEAQLLNRALHGGPTGPGTGIGHRPPTVGHHGGFFGQNGWLGSIGGARPIGGFGHGGHGGFGGAHPNVGVVKPGVPAVINDGTHNIHLNITIDNTNINQHDSSGAGGTQVNNPNTGVPVAPIVIPG